MILDFSKELLEASIRVKELLPGVLAWTARAVTLAHEALDVAWTEGQTEDSAVPFALSIIGVLLRLMRPLTADPPKFVDKVDWSFVGSGSLLDYSSQAKCRAGASAGPSAMGAMAGMAAMGAVEVPPAASTAEFSFPTQLFFLTARAMELLTKIQRSRAAQVGLWWVTGFAGL